MTAIIVGYMQNGIVPLRARRRPVIESTVDDPFELIAIAKNTGARGSAIVLRLLTLCDENKSETHL